MAKILVLEKIEMNARQKEKLESLGDVDFFDNSSVEECRERVQGGGRCGGDRLD